MACFQHLSVDTRPASPKSSLGKARRAQRVRWAFPELVGLRRLRLEFYKQFLLFTRLKPNERRSRRIRRIVVEPFLVAGSVDCQNEVFIRRNYGASNPWVDCLPALGIEIRCDRPAYIKNLLWALV
jgi:hypothetical protein